MAVDDYTYQRQGKEVINYKGLLHLAHERWDDNGFDLGATILNPHFEWGEAVIMAGHLKCPVGEFNDIGDASPENVGQQIKPHYPRMAATRAKARVLRDALDIGAVAVEELADDDEPTPQGQSNASQKSEAQAAPPKGRKGELLTAIRSNLRTIYGDQAVDAERKMVANSKSKKPFNKLSEAELANLKEWSETKAVEFAEGEARRQAQEAEEEGNAETPDELDEAAEQIDPDEIPF